MRSTKETKESGRTIYDFFGKTCIRREARAFSLDCSPFLSKPHDSGATRASGHPPDLLAIFAHL